MHQPADPATAPASPGQSAIVYGAKAGPGAKALAIGFVVNAVFVANNWQEIYAWLQGAKLSGWWIAWDLLMLASIPSSGFALLRRLLADYRHAPRLIVTGEGIEARLIFTRRFAAWAALGPFELRERVVGRRKFFHIEAAVQGDEADAASRRHGKLVIHDQFEVAPAILAQALNARRLETLKYEAIHSSEAGSFEI